MTIELFRENAYLKQCTAQIEGIHDNGISVDQTVFYPNGGGQPGDTGFIIRQDGSNLRITDTRKDKDSPFHLHILEASTPNLTVGETVELAINWDRRHRLMRMHSCMHLLCAVVPAPVTGGSIRDGSARLDFDLPQPPNKVEVEEKLNKLIQQDHPMELSWITDEALDQNPELVRTMSVQPPRGSGKIRLVNFKNVDLQPCGGTHVASSGEIGAVRVVKIEKKGKQNRRITVEFTH